MPVVERAAPVQVETLVLAMGGHMQSASSNFDTYIVSQAAENIEGPTSANVQLRVPSASFESARQQIEAAVVAAGGRVTSQSHSVRDVTSQYIDQVARIRVQERSFAQMSALLQAAHSVEEVLSVKREMDSITYTMEAAKRQAAYLKGASTMSSLSLYVEVAWTPKRPTQPDQDATLLAHLRHTVASALSLLSRMTGVLVDACVYTLILG
ncbi:DUF4349 domain-containing protein, partial [archaeon]